MIAERLLPIPRFRQRVVAEGRGMPRWELDPHFDLASHVAEIVLPAPADEAALQALVGGMMTTPLPADRPLWRFHLVRGYEGGSAVIGQLHHCIADGIALMLVLLTLTDVDGEPALLAGGSPLAGLFQRAAAAVERARSFAEEVMPEALGLMLRSPRAVRRWGMWPMVAGAGALGRLVLRRPDPRTPLKGRLGGAKRVAWSRPIPLERVKGLSRRLGGTINDVLPSALAGALGSYLRTRGDRVEGLSFRAAVPVNLRTLDRMAELGNRFGLIFLSLPVGIADPLARLAEMRRRTAALKGSPEPLVTYGILGAMGRLSHTLQRQVVRIFGTKATTVLTNVPGPRRALAVAGHRLRGLMFWVPQSGNLGLGLSICSYAGEVRLGVASDSGLVPDPEVIVGAFEEELAVMDRLAESAAQPSPISAPAASSR
ncbi:MAG TPA: wax ester/triacylglycerol synthase family O-acyltransferase [Thermoanaerobaculia bacterium]|nr:wax ester/triacylglycerol synthase family O-acyltransferase [Thermoanaerobaculia bacterium]